FSEGALTDQWFERFLRQVIGVLGSVELLKSHIVDRQRQASALTGGAAELDHAVHRRRGEDEVVFIPADRAGIPADLMEKLAVDIDRESLELRDRQPAGREAQSVQLALRQDNIGRDRGSAAAREEEILGALG